MPPTLVSLQQRLEDRGVDAIEAITVRRSRAIDEINEATWFDHSVVNHDQRLDDAVRDVIDIIDREAERNPPRVFVL